MMYVQSMQTINVISVTDPQTDSIGISVASYPVTDEGELAAVDCFNARVAEAEEQHRERLFPDRPVTRVNSGFAKVGMGFIAIIRSQ